ncbi:MAG: PepSY domain-containing protein [Acidobacteria bacterium]|nr:PepSY domain-containing protein [Acidobacteriota bacterium]MBI3427434.1 PepSY domain-containing protein [Acidobacteriota bacterium]
MTIRKTHRVLGLVMLLPLFGWAITGLVFFLKPGYEGAYELLQLKTYPLEQPVAVTPNPSWQEFRYTKTILGNHLLVRTAQGWQQLDPATLVSRAKPSEEDVRRLLQDAFTANPNRYGAVAAINGATITTSTNVKITFDWNRMSVQQRGPDTDRIDRLYKIHYLQWTGVKWLDKLLGLAGLALLVVLSVLGLMLAFNFRVTRAK